MSKKRKASTPARRNTRALALKRNTPTPAATPMRASKQLDAFPTSDNARRRQSTYSKAVVAIRLDGATIAALDDDARKVKAPHVLVLDDEQRSAIASAVVWSLSRAPGAGRYSLCCAEDRLSACAAIVGPRFAHALAEWVYERCGCGRFRDDEFNADVERRRSAVCPCSRESAVMTEDERRALGWRLVPAVVHDLGGEVFVWLCSECVAERQRVLRAG